LCLTHKVLALAANDLGVDLGNILVLRFSDTFYGFSLAFRTSALRTEPGQGFLVAVILAILIGGG
jgi:hypothetical protein